MKSINNHLTSLPKIRKFDGNDWHLTKTSERNLPHWELKGSTYFITVRVVPELGKPFLKPLLANWFMKFLQNHHSVLYELLAFVIMPDHLHLIIKPLPHQTLSKIMQQLKGGSSFQLNKLLNKSGPFWQKESFDHLIRDQAGLRDKWDYIRENPVKAKLVSVKDGYPFSSFNYLPATAG